MIEVASLHYGVIFKKAFCVPEIFNAFVQDVIGVAIEVDEVETERSYTSTVGSVDVTFDLYGQDLKNRVIVGMIHEPYSEQCDRASYYTWAEIWEQIAKAGTHRTKFAIYTVVILMSESKYQQDMVTVDFDPKDRDGNGVNEIPHKIIYLSPKYINEKTPEPLKEWLQAIDDSLDSEVDEERYERPEIHQIFERIQKDLVTPQERARMFDEYNQKELEESRFDQGLEKGREEGLELGIIQNQRRTLIRQMGRKFTKIPADILTRIEESDDVEQLDRWLDALWDAETLVGFIKT